MPAYRLTPYTMLNCVPHVHREFINATINWSVSIIPLSRCKYRSLNLLYNLWYPRKCIYNTGAVANFKQYTANNSSLKSSSSIILKLSFHLFRKTFERYSWPRPWLHETNSTFQPLERARSTFLRNPPEYSASAASPLASTIVDL